MNLVTAEGWGVRLDGHLFDLQDWAIMFHPPFDPWVERRERVDEDMFILRSHKLNSLATADEVREKSIPLVERLNGAALLVCSSQPLRCGPVARFDSEGRIFLHHYLDASVGLYRTRFGPIDFAVGLSSETMPPSQPVRSDSQRWIAASEANDDLADLLIHLARADNWYDLYKAIELTEALAGGEHRLSKLLGTEAKFFKNLRTTANFYRHSRAMYKPTVPVNFAEARAGLLRAVCLLLNHQFPA